MNLAQALGYDAEDKLLIINADDYGMCHSANAGIQQLLAESVISSATIMMPCPWAKEAALWAAAHPQTDIGIHLTFTSEWNTFKWGPVSRGIPVSSLITEHGYFPQDPYAFETQAESKQVCAEIISQIELSLQMGLKPTHLDNHMGSLYGLQTGRDFLGLVIDLCAQWGLPLRMPRYLSSALPISPSMRHIHSARVHQADIQRVIIPDYLINLPFAQQQGETYDTFRKTIASKLLTLQPGVTEVFIHPAVVTQELKAIHPHWAKRGMELEIFRDPVIKKVITEQHIRKISWRDLQVLQLSLK